MASELCLTGRVVRGTEARDIGLVDHVVSEHDALLPRARELAAAMAANPTPQALMIKLYDLWNPDEGKSLGAAAALKKAQEYVRCHEKWKHPYLLGGLGVVGPAPALGA